MSRNGAALHLTRQNSTRRRRIVPIESIHHGGSYRSVFVATVVSLDVRGALQFGSLFSTVSPADMAAALAMAGEALTASNLNIAKVMESTAAAHNAAPSASSGAPAATTSITATAPMPAPPLAAVPSPPAKPTDPALQQKGQASANSSTTGAANPIAASESPAPAAGAASTTPAAAAPTITVDKDEEKDKEEKARMVGQWLFCKDPPAETWDDNTMTFQSATGKAGRTLSCSMSITVKAKAKYSYLPSRATLLKLLIRKDTKGGKHAEMILGSVEPAAAGAAAQAVQFYGPVPLSLAGNPTGEGASEKDKMAFELAMPKWRTTCQSRPRRTRTPARPPTSSAASRGTARPSSKGANNKPPKLPGRSSRSGSSHRSSSSKGKIKLSKHKREDTEREMKDEGSNDDDDDDAEAEEEEEVLPRQRAAKKQKHAPASQTARDAELSSKSRGTGAAQQSQQQAQMAQWQVRGPVNALPTPATAPGALGGAARQLPNPFVQAWQGLGATTNAPTNAPRPKNKAHSQAAIAYAVPPTMANAATPAQLDPAALLAQYRQRHEQRVKRRHDEEAKEEQRRREEGAREEEEDRMLTMTLALSAASQQQAATAAYAQAYAAAAAAFAQSSEMSDT